MRLNIINLAKFTLFSSLLVLVSCGGSLPPTYGARTSPNILASDFVAALSAVDGTSSNSMLIKNTDATLRTQQSSGNGQWFVIWDEKYCDYKAVDLNYVRTIVYYDYYSNNNAVASEFRRIEKTEIDSGNNHGDYHGNDYEVVDYNTNTGYYVGRHTGFSYEDEVSTTDVSLLAKDQEKMKFFEKAAKISFTYNVSIETSMSMVTLGSKIEKMLSHGSGEITPNDQAALLGDLKSLTGVSIEEIQAAASDSKVKADVLAKVAKKIGTSSQNLEQKFLPEVFGIVL